MAKKKRRHRRAPSTGRSRLEDHKKVGNVLIPPLKQLPTDVTTVPWLRDVFPDMLWLCSLCVVHGEAAPAIASHILDIVNELVGGDNPDVFPRLVADGRLTAFEEVPFQVRTEILDRLELEGRLDAAFPASYLNAVALYEDLPGRWLMPVPGEIDRDAAEGFLAEVTRTSLHGGDEVPTMAKVMAGRPLIKSGKVVIPDEPKFEIFKQLDNWPKDISTDTRLALESVMRAAFLTMALPMEEEGWLPIRDWARNYWRSNWNLFDCAIAIPDEDDEAEVHSDVTDQLVAAWMTLFSRFIAATNSDPDLYDPDRYEVLSGISARALRLTRVLVRDPLLWSGEFGGSLARAVLEALIVLRWLLREEGANPEIFAKFKDHGRGRLKLYKLHLAKELDSLGDEAPEAVMRQLHQLQEEVSRDVDEELQEIDLSGRFSKTDLRKMAKAVGMHREYTTMLAPASSATHGEWSALDRYSLIRCRNPLHRGHRLIQQGPGPTFGPGLPLNALGMSDLIVDDYERSFGVRQDQA